MWVIIKSEPKERIDFKMTDYDKDLNPEVIPENLDDAPETVFGEQETNNTGDAFVSEELSPNTPEDAYEHSSEETENYSYGYASPSGTPSGNYNGNYNGYSFYSENIRPAEKKHKKWHTVVGVFAGILGGIILTTCVGAAVLVRSGLIKMPEKPITENSAQNSENSFDFSRLEDGEREAKSLVDIAAEVGPSVVMVTTTATVNTFFGTSSQQGSGSGIIISEDGYIITNNHVIENAQMVKVTLSDGNEYAAQVVGSDPQTDIAIIKINDASNLTVAVMGDSDKLQVGELAVAIGNPLGKQLTGTVTQGIISAVNRTVQASENTYVNLIQTDAAINAGNSGGALVNGYGEVVGINTVKYAASGVEGIGFAIPINDAMPIARDLIDRGYVSGRPLIGVTLIEVTNQLAAINNIPVGLYVNNVQPGSAASEGGVKIGDVIVKADGKEVATVAELNEIRNSKKVGDPLEFEIYRDGKNITLTIYLKEDRTNIQTGIEN